MNKTILILLVIIIGISVWFLVSKSSKSQSGIIAQNGLHWHADLIIKILGEDQEIPANIGLGITERPIHTHEPDGVIHMEFSRLVKKDDIQLGKFFEVWGKKFSENCIFDKCSGEEGQLKMFVNKEPNFEFENYVMRDRDKIEIIFE